MISYIFQSRQSLLKYFLLTMKKFIKVLMYKYTYGDIITYFFILDIEK